jgi:hypothetical protein
MIFMIFLLESKSFCISIQPGHFVCMQSAVLVGQLLGGLAQPFFTNSPAKLAGEWFPTSERNLATTIASMCNPLGIALGQVGLWTLSVHSWKNVSIHIC